MTFRDVTELLENIHAAFVAGYDQGERDGRRAERVILEQEAAIRHAGRIVAALAEHPEVDPDETAARRERWERRWTA